MFYPGRLSTIGSFQAAVMDKLSGNILSRTQKRDRKFFITRKIPGSVYCVTFSNFTVKVGSFPTLNYRSLYESRTCAIRRTQKLSFPTTKCQIITSFPYERRLKNALKEVFNIINMSL